MRVKGLPTINGEQVKLDKKAKSNLLANVTTGYTLAKAAYDFWSARQDKLREAKLLYVSVQDEDSAYTPLHEWLMQNAEMDSRSIRVQSFWKESRLYPRLFLESDTPKTVTIKGHEIRVSISSEDNAKASSDGYIFKAPDKMIFEMTTPAAQKAVIEFITEICEQESGAGGRFFTMSPYGDWIGGSPAPRRPIESVFLAGSQKEDMIKDLEVFLGSEELYNNAGIPWHRGYLFHGPAGTGKTSLARALASHFDLDVYYISLGDLQKDSKLLNIMRSINPKSILLLEDIDVFSSTHSREASKDEVSLSGLLNALDGVATPHGLITIMTTNHRETLDESVTRPGRVDKDIEIGYAGSKQVSDMFRFYYGEELGFTFTVPQTRPSQITEVFKTNMQNAEDARQILMGMQAQDLDRHVST